MKIIENGKVINSAKLYPALPFVIKDKDDDRLYLVFCTNEEEYSYINLTSTEHGYEELLEENRYCSLDELFENNPNFIILNSELIIKDEYKGEK